MKEKRLKGLMTILFSLILVLTLVSLSTQEVKASKEAQLGSSLGEVLLNWKLLILNGPSYIEGSGLDSSLVSLRGGLEKLNSPSSLIRRINPLRKKLERAETEDLWTYQFGYWNFAQEDPTVSLSGAKREEDILIDSNRKDGLNSGRIGFRYLGFDETEDEASIMVGESLDVPLSEDFTIEFWIRVRKGSADRVVKTKNWSLSLDEYLPVLKDSSGIRILEGKKMTSNNWTHLALIRDRSEVSLYQNGTEVDRVTMKESISISDQIVLGGGLIGDIDELRIKDSSVEREYLNFDRPIDYLVGFPVLTWAQSRFAIEELWHFYAGLLISNIKLKADSQQYSISGNDVTKVASFLLAETETELELPPTLPNGVIDEIKKMHQLGNNDGLTEKERDQVEQIIGSLAGYLDII